MDETVKCPKCKEEIMADAEVCKHCSFNLLRFRKKEKGKVFKKELKEKYKRDLIKYKPKLWIVSAGIVMLYLVYILLATVVFPEIRGQENEDRIIIGTQFMLTGLLDKTFKIPYDQAAKYCADYIDNGNFPYFWKLYTPIRNRCPFSIYKLYHKLIKKNVEYSKVIDYVLYYDESYAEKYILQNNVIEELNKAERYLKIGDRNKALSKLNDAVEVLTANQLQFYADLDKKFRYSQSFQAFSEYYCSKYASQRKNSYDTSCIHFVVINNLGNGDNEPNWMNKLFPTSFLCFNTNTVCNYPIEISYYRPIIIMAVGTFVVWVLMVLIYCTVIYFKARKAIQYFIK